MIDRRTYLPLFLLVLLSLMLAACGAQASTGSGPDDPAGIRAAVPIPVEEQGETAAVSAVVEAPNITEEPDVAPEAGSVGQVAAPSDQKESTRLHPSAPITVSDGTLSDEAVGWLTFMREEEKLALDVYTFLFDTWGLPIFNNVAASEAQHTASVLSVMEAYGVADPVADLAAGQFADDGLQALYEQLVARGELSPADALLVGGLIEEVDLADLEQALTQATNSDLLQLFTNLRLGSVNHLLAFASNYERQTAVAYSPQRLDAGAFESLLIEAPARQGANGNGQAGSGNGQGAGMNEQAGNGSGRRQGGNGRGDGGNGNGYRGGQG